MIDNNIMEKDEDRLSKSIFRLEKYINKQKSRLYNYTAWSNEAKGIRANISRSERKLKDLYEHKKWLNRYGESPSIKRRHGRTWIRGSSRRRK